MISKTAKALIAIASILTAVGTLISIADESLGVDDEPTVIYDGKWGFIINEGTVTATLTEYTQSNVTVLNIPNTVSDGTNTYSVTAIGSGTQPLLMDGQIAKNGASVTLGATITAINENAFSGVTKFKGSLTIPDTVTAIGDNAFKNCGFNGNLTLGTHLATIGDFAFAGTKFVGSLNLPDSLVSIGEGSFQGCDGFTGELILPDSVVTLGEGAFAESDGFTALIFGTGANSNLTAIPALMVYNCKSLAGMVELPHSVTSIGDGAFANTAITNLWIDSEVNDIGLRIVQGCSELRVVVNYSSAEILPDTSIPAGTLVFDTAGVQGQFHFFANDTIAILTQYDGSGVSELVVPAYVTDDDVTRTVVGLGFNLDDISDSDSGIFYHQSFSSVQLPATLQYIGVYSFFGCANLTEITISESVTSIGKDAFRGCTNLKTVYNESVLSFEKGKDTEGCVALYADAVYNGLVVSEDLMYQCVDGFASVFKVVSARSTYLIPTTVYNHGAPYIVDRIASTSSANMHNGVFSNLLSITSITLPVTLTNIGKDAFYGCANLQTVSLPSTLESIGDYAFYGCTSLHLNALPPGIVKIGNRAFMNTPITVSVLPATLLSIGESAFRSTNVGIGIIPMSVTAVGQSAFADADYITRMEFTQPTQVAIGVLASCGGMTSVVFPDGLVSVPASVCEDCTSLTSARVPSTVTSISQGAFQGCTALTGIQLPDGLKVISQNGFNGSGLTSITLPKDLTQIQSDAFKECTALDRVTNNSALFVTMGADDNGKVALYATHVVNNVPHQFDKYKITTNDTDVTITAYTGGNTDYLMIPGQFTSTVGAHVMIYTTVAIGNDVFKGMKVGTVIIPDTVASIGANAFKGATIRLYQLPSALTYIGDSAFQDTSSVIFTALPEGVTYIGEYAFAGTGSTFTSAPSALHIGAGAFQGCRMASFMLPDYMVVIPDALFKDCSLLSYVNLSGIVQIGDYAFQNCPLFTGFTTIPQDMTYIGQYAFQNDVGLVSLMVIGADNLTVGTNAFDGCVNLKSLTDFSTLGLSLGSTENGKMAFYADSIQYTMSDVGLINLIEVHDKAVKQKTEGWWVMIAVIPIIVLVGIIIMAVRSFIGKDEDEDYYDDGGYSDEDYYDESSGEDYDD